MDKVSQLEEWERGIRELIVEELFGLPNTPAARYRARKILEREFKKTFGQEIRPVRVVSKGHRWLVTNPLALHKYKADGWDIEEEQPS